MSDPLATMLRSRCAAIGLRMTVMESENIARDLRAGVTLTQPQPKCPHGFTGEPCEAHRHLWAVGVPCQDGHHVSCPGRDEDGNECGCLCGHVGEAAPEAGVTLTQPRPIPGIEPHRYIPDAMAMGDCKVCGHVYKDHQPQPDAVLREALTDIRDTTLDQPAAVNVPDEDWYRRLLLRAMGIARAALRSTPAAPDLRGDEPYNTAGGHDDWNI